MFLGLYLSDVLCTSWNCVVDTGVEKGDVVAIWGAGKCTIQTKYITTNTYRPYRTDVCANGFYEWCLESHHH